MAYRIKALPDKKKSPKWKVQYATYSSKKRIDKDIPREDWKRLGFHEDMTFEEACSIRDTLNAQEKIKREEESRIKIKATVTAKASKYSAYLNPMYVAEFETSVLIDPLEVDGEKKNKRMSFWLAAQKMIVELKLDPQDWYERRNEVYAYFAKNKYSPSYMNKVLGIANQFNYFIARKKKLPFYPIPAPRGRAKAVVAKRYLDKNGGRGQESDPITPAQLESKHSALKPELWNWLYLSVWLGLRPDEVDKLHDPKYHRFEKQKDGIIILWIYQTKLILVSEDKRWKPIPLLLKEQLKVQEIIKSKEFKRPLAKTIRSHFGEHTTLYGGRKGFVDLMMSNDQPLEYISQWMGHTTIDRTIRSYKDKNKVHYKKVG
jgi:hypothetical protein